MLSWENFSLTTGLSVANSGLGPITLIPPPLTEGPIILIVSPGGVIFAGAAQLELLSFAHATGRNCVVAPSVAKHMTYQPEKMGLSLVKSACLIS